ncbi:hypothetical protein [Catenulispora rubra]|uniref:hypothetical protein n=1 Tax=Catenulispora rubra TaxID=280293 RepID=UPI0018922876|nr:hypothetical protein [Catenulispora rubra]
MVVQIKEKVGLDWADELGAMLQDSTGLRWVRDPERERAATGETQGVDTIILVAALTSVVDTAVKTLLHRANEAAREWRKGRLDAPEIDVAHEGGEPSGAPASDPDGAPADDPDHGVAQDPAGD